MAIPLTLLESTARNNPSPRRQSTTAAKQAGRRAAFICHSHRDRERVEGFVILLERAGFSAYVDWADQDLPETPDRETAAKIKSVIVSADLFLFLATPNSIQSRWCPWEIGYADGKKPIDSILIVPTAGTDGRTIGNEYLQLYRRIDIDAFGELKLYRPRSLLGESVRQI